MTIKRILATGAGGPAGINFVMSLRLAPEKLYLVGTESDAYRIHLTPTEKKYMVPSAADADYVNKLNEIVEKEKIEFLHPQPDIEVAIISESREKIRATTFLPSKEAVRMCQDKYESAKRWKRRGVPVAEAMSIENEADAETALEQLGTPIWIRATHGAGGVGDTHEYGLDVPPRPTVYVNLFQRPRPAITLTMLSDADTRLLASAARGILQDLNPEIPARFRTFSQVYSASLGSRRFNVILIGFFGITALLLATIGVFGVMAYSVSRRTREIGVRVALGAASGDVLRMILGQGLRTIFIGVALGIAGSLALTRTVESLLFGVTATDPLTFGGVTLLLVGAALLACYIPARRATKVDPMVALRYE